MNTACRYKSKKKAFCHYSKKYADGSKSIEADLEQLRKQSTVIRVLVHTQIGKIGFGQKKAHLAEIQVRRRTLHQSFVLSSVCHRRMSPSAANSTTIKCLIDSSSRV